LHLTQIALKRKPDWPKRVARAEELAERYSWEREVLRFYSRVLELQGELYEKARAASESATLDQNLRTVLDFSAAAKDLLRMIAVVERHGPAAMAEAAAEMKSSGAAKSEQLLRACAAGETLSPVEYFLALTVLQPYAERISYASAASNTDSGRGLCPVCDGKPLVSVLRPEGDGAKRWLLCSFCLMEWEFRRILCPYCGEQDNDKLPLFKPAVDTSAISVHACTTCRRYLKAIDTTVDGHAVPMVDEVAAGPLDMWGVGEGFQKLQPNLLGF
jgi:FdhE protein